jgi:hypothetical protein
MSSSQSSTPEQNSQRPDIQHETLQLIGKIAAFKGELQRFQKEHLQASPMAGQDEDNGEPDPLNKSFDDFIKVLSREGILAYGSDLPGTLDLYASGLLMPSTRTYQSDDRYYRLCALLQASKGGNVAYTTIVNAYKQLLADVEAYRTPELAGPDYESDLDRMWSPKLPRDALSVFFGIKRQSNEAGSIQSAIALGGTSIDEASVFENSDVTDSLNRLAMTLRLTYNTETLKSLLIALQEPIKAVTIALNLGTTYTASTQGE